MSEFFIPKEITVGYQERGGTYTGKLAYVIYTDEKGILRKEKSWNSWRDEKIPSDDFKNEPTEGFVLNKHVGGYKSDWNFRQSYCRIYDPRGFEFEITIDNLLWILEHEDCTHGKGLSGKYVYGWSGTDLILIPCSTKDYTDSQSYSDTLFTTKITKSSFIPGNSYHHKCGKDYIFVGEFKLAFGKDGKPFKKLLFVPVPDPNQKEYRYYSDDCIFDVEKPKDEAFLLSFDKTSFQYETGAGLLTKEQIADYTYRFSLSALSADFWKNPNIIDYFEEFKNEYSEAENRDHSERYKKYYGRDDSSYWYYDYLSHVDGFDGHIKNERCGLVSEDKKHVQVLAPYTEFYKSEDRDWNGRDYSGIIYRDSNIICGTVTSTGIITYSGKIGKILYDWPDNAYDGGTVEGSQKNLYENLKNGTTKLENLTIVSDEDVKKFYNLFRYVTKDGYKSDSLCYLAAIGVLSGEQLVKRHYSRIPLPCKEISKIIYKQTYDD